MNPARVPIAREGWPYILAPAILAEVLALAGSLWWALAAFAVALFCAWFFRDPERYHHHQPDQIVSPADGKIIFIGQVTASPISGQPALKISIFMSVFNVHVNRAPADARVLDMDYRPGKFVNASFDKASDENERLVLAWQTPKGHYFESAQVAGLIARRIVCYAEPGDEYIAGERYGLIRFGSRVDLYLPVDTGIDIGRGAKVVAGQTVLGKLARRPEPEEE